MSYNQQTPPPYYGGGNNYNGYHASQAEVVQTTSSVMKRVYFKMFLGLLVTAFISLFCANSMSFMSFVATNSWFYWGLFIAELALVFVLSARVMKMSSAAATLMFFAFAALNGMTLAPIFLVYTMTSIAKTFFYLRRYVRCHECLWLFHHSGPYEMGQFPVLRAYRSDYCFCGKYLHKKFNS